MSKKREQGMAKLRKVMADLHRMPDAGATWVGCALLTAVRADGGFKPETLRMVDIFIADLDRRNAHLKPPFSPN